MKVKPLDIAFKVIDPAQMLDEGEKWSKLYDEIVVESKGSSVSCAADIAVRDLFRE